MDELLLLPREQEMQLVGQTSVEGKLLQDAWTTRTIADAKNGTVEIEDDLSRGFELIVIALCAKFLGRIMKRLECESRSAVLAPRCAEVLTLRFFDGEGRDAQAVPLGVEEGEQRGTHMVASILWLRIMGVLFADGTLPQSVLRFDESVGIGLIGAEAIPDEVFELLWQSKL